LCHLRQQFESIVWGLIEKFLEGRRVDFPQLRRDVGEVLVTLQIAAADRAPPFFFERGLRFFAGQDPVVIGSAPGGRGAFPGSEP
jgi:hypothetical protein